jgi:hypothetical protein
VVGMVVMLVKLLVGMVIMLTDLFLIVHKDCL